MVGAPGFDPGRLQRSAAPVYKTEPHASADAVIGRSGRKRTGDLFVPDEEVAGSNPATPTNYGAGTGVRLGLVNRGSGLL